jgi:hypothetical protein
MEKGRKRNGQNKRTEGYMDIWEKVWKDPRVDHCTKKIFAKMPDLYK